ncbi:hypothetical protein KIPB_008333 [Kipferlia bialata]|uniref:Uncharacterized protein n=1 Tax=Kipferlia bialata TaxID=797122 RepID=A0A9K3GL86_9EUKA|nr:hypothetical protein KIPB_008333 [Kipferlia bialata]|eukprot:g8333.t1
MHGTSTTDTSARGERGESYRLELPSCGNAHLESIIKVLNGEASADTLPAPSEGAVLVLYHTIEEVEAICSRCGPTFLPLAEAVVGPNHLRPGIHAVVMAQIGVGSENPMGPLSDLCDQPEASYPKWFKGLVLFKTSVDAGGQNTVLLWECLSSVLARYSTQYHCFAAYAPERPSNDISSVESMLEVIYPASAVEPKGFEATAALIQECNKEMARSLSAATALNIDPIPDVFERLSERSKSLRVSVVALPFTDDRDMARYAASLRAKGLSVTYLSHNVDPLATSLSSELRVGLDVVLCRISDCNGKDNTLMKGLWEAIDGNMATSRVMIAGDRGKKVLLKVMSVSLMSLREQLPWPVNLPGTPAGEVWDEYDEPCMVCTINQDSISGYAHAARKNSSQGKSLRAVQNACDKFDPGYDVPGRDGMSMPCNTVRFIEYSCVY